MSSSIPAGASWRRESRRTSIHRDTALSRPHAELRPSDIAVVPVDRLELAFAPRPWPFASERRGEIDAHFAALRRVNPALWNGRVLMLHQYSIAEGVFRGSYLETDFASLLAWRHWDFPDGQMKNCFAMAALRGSDDAFLLGVMAPHTANAGRIYFPAGLPDLSDVDGMQVDLARNVAREIWEETGLSADDFEAQPGWTTVLAGPRIAQIKTFRAAETAETLRRRVLANLASQAQPELLDIRIVNSPSDFDPMMPSFVTAFLTHVWKERSEYPP
jgi:8-oxo-dGTP pyrophosphatase MutT (NUDIX family)